MILNVRRKQRAIVASGDKEEGRMHARNARASCKCKLSAAPARKRCFC
jgi:hypothetical protein